MNLAQAERALQCAEGDLREQVALAYPLRMRVRIRYGCGWSSGTVEEHAKDGDPRRVGVRRDSPVTKYNPRRTNAFAWHKHTDLWPIGVGE